MLGCNREKKVTLRRLVWIVAVIVFAEPELLVSVMVCEILELGGILKVCVIDCKSSLEVC